MTIYRNEKQDSKFRQHYGWVEAGLQVKGYEVYRSLLCCYVDRIVQIVLCLLCVQFLEPKCQFRSLLPQLSLTQLLEDVIGKDCNECYGRYRDRGVPNCKLIAS